MGSSVQVRPSARSNASRESDWCCHGCGKRAGFRRACMRALQRKSHWRSSVEWPSTPKISCFRSRNVRARGKSNSAGSVPRFAPHTHPPKQPPACGAGPALITGCSVALLCERSRLRGNPTTVILTLNGPAKSGSSCVSPCALRRVTRERRPHHGNSFSLRSARANDAPDARIASGRHETSLTQAWSSDARPGDANAVSPRVACA